MRRRAFVLGVAVAALATGWAGPAWPQSNANCKVPSFRGATTSAGASTTMTLVNDGRPCSFRTWVHPELRVPPDQLRVVRAPQQGILTITQPDTVHYTPNAGFAGSDTFQYGGQGRNRGGDLLTLLVTMEVTVLPGPAGGR